MTAVGPVRALARTDADRVTDVLCESFHDYPLLRYVLGAPSPDYDSRLDRLIGLFVAARVLRREPLLGILDGEELVAAALVSFPKNHARPPELCALREDVWTVLGPETRARYESSAAVWRPLTVDVPSLHLNMLGVRRSRKGRGLGRRLLDHVQEMSRDAGVEGVTLTTEDPANVPLYQRVGYAIIGHAEIVPGLETWGFFRSNGPAGSAPG